MDEPLTRLNIRSCQNNNSSAKTWLVEPDDVATGFRENGNYWIRSTGKGDRFFVDDEECETDGEDWVWSPGFFAGRVRAELISSCGILRATYELDVSPNPDKLGCDMFDTMLEQIWAFSPSLALGVEPATLSVGHEGDTLTPWLQYARFRAYGEKFLRAMSIISQQPVKELIAERAHLPIPLVRRVDRQTALTALKEPQILPLLGYGSGSTALFSGPPTFNVPIARETLDSAANRCLAAIVWAVLHRITKLRLELQKIVDKETLSKTRTPLSGRWPRRKEYLDRIEQRLRQLQRSSPLSDVTKRVVSAAGLNAISADPAYSSAYGLGWRILRRGAEGPPQQERLWISPTWEVYERWCFVQLCKYLTELLGDHECSISTKKTSYANAVFSGSKGGKQRFELLLQPRFPAYDQKPNDNFKSLSGEREPDIVLMVNEGEYPKWYVFDAKYRSGRSNILNAMTSAHVYSDALRWNKQKSNCVLLLVPQAGKEIEWLKQSDFIDKHGVGVQALVPDIVPCNIFRLLVGTKLLGYE